MGAESGALCRRFLLPSHPRYFVDRDLIQDPCRPGPALNFVLPTGSPFGILTHPSRPVPSTLPLDFSVQQRPPWNRPILGWQPVSGTRWPFTHRLLRFPSEAHLTRPRPSSHGNPALQSQGGQDENSSQIVQGVGQPTRSALSDGGAQVRR
jgi:hypothetical protein